MQPNTRSWDDARLGAPFWVAVVALGIAIGVATAALMALLRFVQHAVWGEHGGTFLAAVSRSAPGYRIAALALAGAAGGVAIRLLRARAGRDGFEVNRRLWERATPLPFLGTTAVAALSMILVGAGASVGREHSVKQTGALLGSKFAELCRMDAADWRVLTALGSATAMGAVYNMPIGGALFGLEVLIGSFELRLAVPALTMAGIATLFSWIYEPAHPLYRVPAYGLAPLQILWAAIVGPVVGVASAAWVRLVREAARRQAARTGLLVAPLAVLTALGAVATSYPQLLGNGKDVVQLAFAGRLALGTAAALVALKPLATAACLWSGIPGGLFTPTLALGALLGVALGAPWAHLFPGTPLGAYAMVGGGAMIAAATQGPLSAIVMLAELTGTLTPLLVPLTLATVSATAVSRALVRDSIYSGRL